MTKEISLNAINIKEIPDEIEAASPLQLDLYKKGNTRKSGSLIKYNSAMWTKFYDKEEKTTRCLSEFIDLLLSTEMFSYVNSLNPKSKFIVVRLPVITTDIIQDGGIKTDYMRILCNNNIDLDFWYY